MWKEVEFLEAVEELKEGGTIQSITGNLTFEYSPNDKNECMHDGYCLCDQYGKAVSTFEILKGRWFKWIDNNKKERKPNE
jgi:hypothetical protein